MERLIEVEKMEHLINLFGSFDENVRLIEKELDVAIINRGSEIKVAGEPDGVDRALSTIQNLLAIAARGDSIGEQEVRYVLSQIEAGNAEQLEELGKDVICISTRGVPIKAKTLGQKQYVNSMKDSTIVFGIGPAGTGKTYLAVAMAISMLQQHQVKRIVLTRPAVEAGERLGFLPGDLADKVNPYLRPLYDALHDMVPQPKVASMLEVGTIEVAPLAFMRGRTLNDAFIILDEAQNTTHEQMKMFLTRMGFGSRVVVTGDTSQIDLPVNPSSGRARSGLVHALAILDKIPGLAVHHFSKADVVRHPLVGAIVNAYDNAEKDS